LTTLTSKEIERKRILVSKFKEDAINHIEIQELMAILKKAKHIAEEEDEEGRKWYVGMCNIISNLPSF
jgi:hypothetical protein